jgi:ferredoxin-NADP reductase
MTDAARPRRLGVWKEALILEIKDRTPSIKSFWLDVGREFRHVSGQHVIIKLTDPDGYAVMRSYSIASPPTRDGIIEVAIERLLDGEVSSFFHDVAAVGDSIELRGPIGGHFVWSPAEPNVSLLIAGGSGVVPMMAIVREHARENSKIPLGLLLSARTGPEAPFFEELVELEASCDAFSFTATFTRARPARMRDHGRRVDQTMVTELIERIGGRPAQTFICGSNLFVNAATDSALAAGVLPQTIRTERYGG